MMRENDQEKDAFFTFSDIEMTAVTILSTATDTSLAVISGIMMVFAKYPNIQQRVRAEVLQLSGGEAPNEEIVGSLKYLEACFYEFLRWRPPAPQAAAHSTAKDDTSLGYRIPKASAIIANVWYIHYLAAYYDAPEVFNPERWLKHPFGMRPDQEHDATQMESTGRRLTYAFGAGRRICPRMESAKKNLPLGTAKFLWASEILPPYSAKGIDPSMEMGYISDLALRPKVFDVKVKLRERLSKENIVKHYVATYKGETEIMGWEDTSTCSREQIQT
ncbi:hypothetical protein G6514_002654 [Epicoccum nigrum]|nr:hypothetical protein G6514_002654 [Epicoccum nigrum]